MSIDNRVVTSEILGVDDTIENHAADDEDEDRSDKSNDESPPTWQEALAALRVIRNLINASSDEMSVVNSYLNHVENVIIHCTYSRARQIIINEVSFMF